MNVAIIIPARNEAEALRRVLHELPRGVAHDVIVVDNGSTDETPLVAAQGGARVVREQTPGYGRACLAGLAALHPDVDTVVFMDGDHSDYPEELPLLLAPIQEGRADMVIGSRAANAEPGSLAPQQRFGNWLACSLMHWLYGVCSTDLGPFRAIRRDALRQLHMQDQAFGWTVEMQAKAARMGLRVVEVPVRYRPRIGRSKISGTLSGTIRAGTAIISTIIAVALTGQRANGPTGQRANRLLVFLKYPTPGQVKTRLAATIGAAAACEVYRACVQTTLSQLKNLCKDIALYVDPPQKLQETATWLGSEWSLGPQQGETLGDRLAEATSAAFSQRVQRVVVIGTDSPWLQPSDIEQAFAALESADLVLGPTEDGGYYLIGLAQPQPALFEGIAWGTPRVFEQTQRRAAGLGLQVAMLPLGYDVDRLEDVQRLLADERMRRHGSAFHGYLESVVALTTDYGPRTTD